jgi:5'-nucleotidase
VTAISERLDPKHRPYYWIDEAQDEWEADERSDYQAVRAGYVSVTPLQPDLTAHRALRGVERLLGAAPRAARGATRPRRSEKKSLGKTRRMR